MQPSCAILVPIYKAKLTEYEKISLTQLGKILGNYTIIFFHPETLNIEPALIKFSFAKNTISFSDKYFQNIHGYNSLMLSSSFYEKFLGYDYVLIYQLDAFVFRDEINFWCGKGYDYIGAPWLRFAQYPDIFKKTKNRLKRYIHTKYNFKEKVTDFPTDIQFENKVGNGGLSLRQVDKFFNLSIKYKEIAGQYIGRRHPTYNEDRFWSIEVNRRKKELNIPDYKTALRFSIETYCERALKINNHQLPFGCHAWDKNIEFWKPFFLSEGYTI